MADGGNIDIRSARAAVGLSHAEEKRIALALSPAVAWPTLALAVILPVSLIGLIWLGWTGAVPYGIASPVLGLLMYAHYTLVHESVHGNVVARPTSLNWVNTVVGWIGSLGLGMGWPQLQRGHLLHHAHTNTDQDPDIGVKGTFAALLVKWIIGIPLNMLPMFTLAIIMPKRWAYLRKTLTPGELVAISAVGVAQIALLVAAVATGYFEQWLWLWLVPKAIASIILMTFFSWLPHHPFDSTERYKNTRISLWTGGTLILLQQNLHLMHHLWPSVPFYNYARLFRALRPVLAIEGSRIEGLMVGPYRRDLSGPRR
ncbi:fatty acid desaturase [Phenylobacterium sp.]|uniref:fatty acid desaturase n=1 Tax=Phenylobacterium sp. TaxID=1871053 RepID=UPI0025EE60C6|nr:fatty acid desaturase [Phenylobacterium sp.]MBX3486260.1 fatty acid desaturase [Phenylobacterium sp.]